MSVNETEIDQVKPQALGMVNESEVTYANLPIVMGQADRQWQHYGHVLAPIAFKNRWSKLDTRSGYYLWMQNESKEGEPEQLTERKLLRDSQTFFPHEEVSHQLTEVFETELKDSGLRILSERASHHGDTMHWEIISDKLSRNITNSYIGKDDVVQFGAMVRNGIGTSVALGVDLYTYRQWCSNGAIARGKDLGSFSISHIRRKNERIQDALIPAIQECVSHLKDFTNYYQQATKINFNQRILDEIVKRISPSDKMMPSYVFIDYDLRRKKEKNPDDRELWKQPEFTVTPQAKAYDMWHVFNDFTQNYWHNKNMSFHRVSQKEQGLHRVLIASVEGKLR